MKERMKKITSLVCVTVLTAALVSGCGSASSAAAVSSAAPSTASTTAVSSAASTTAASSAASTTAASSAAASTTAASTTAASTAAASSKPANVMSDEEITKKAAKDKKVGNWGLGNEYEVQALLSKYSLPTTYLSQAFDMDGFDDDSITLASAMTYNELGLVKNSYQGGYKYGNKVGTIDMNDQGVAMLEDNIFCTKDFASKNPNTVKAFLYASMEGWKYACEHPDEAAQICFKYGSSVSADHQKYMAGEVKKLVETNTKGNAVSDLGNMDETAMQQTLDLAKKYIKLDDSAAEAKLQAMTLDDVRDASYLKAATASSDGKFGTPEKSSVSIQLKWLPQAQFMGYFVAKEKGYYKAAGLDVKIVAGGGDISETTAVNNGTVDFGVTWVSNLISANAGGMKLTELAQTFQRSGLVLVYKYSNFSK